MSDSASSLDLDTVADPSQKKRLEELDGQVIYLRIKIPGTSKTEGL